MNALQRLVHARMDELNMNPRDLARASGLPPSTVYAIMKPPGMRSRPRTPTLQRLATGLQVPLGVVDRAAQESTALVVTDLSEPDVDMTIIVASARELSPELRRMLRRQAEDYLRLQEDQQGLTSVRK